MTGLEIDPHDPSSIRAMFDRLAPRYELLNTLLTFGLVRGWRRSLVDAVRIRPGDRVLDVCAGTGQTLEEVGRAVGPRGLAVGIDFTEAMLRRATGRRVLADALRLPFADAEFDAAVSAFALRDVADQRRMIEEMARVTRRGGRIGLLEIGPPARQPFRLGFDVWFRGAVPFIAAAFGQGESHRFLVRSVSYLPTRERLGTMARAAGLADARSRDLTWGAARAVVARRV